MEIFIHLNNNYTSQVIHNSLLCIYIFTQYQRDNYAEYINFFQTMVDLIKENRSPIGNLLHTVAEVMQEKV